MAKVYVKGNEHGLCLIKAIEINHSLFVWISGPSPS